MAIRIYIDVLPVPCSRVHLLPARNAINQPAYCFLLQNTATKFSGKYSAATWVVDIRCFIKLLCYY
jgi:hypothetical protein